MLTLFLDLVLHLDVHLAQLSATLGPWLYLVLFLIIFCETGLVVTPFLPGDSLLFAAGAVAALEGSGLDVRVMWALLIAAAFLGDNVNYLIGRWIGPRIFNRPKSIFLDPDHLRKTQAFYDNHGGKTVFFARFMPILRTFAPFVAGVGAMNRRHFVVFSLTGSLCWMTIFLGAGYWFGNIAWVQRNFASLIMALIVISLMPFVIALIRQRLAASRVA